MLWVTALCYFTSFFWLFFPTRCCRLGKGTWFSARPNLYQQDYTCTRCLMVRVLHARLPCYCCILIPADIKDFMYKPSWRCVLLNTLPAQTHVKLFKLFISLLLVEWIILRVCCEIFVVKCSKTADLKQVKHICWQECISLCLALDLLVDVCFHRIGLIGGGEDRREEPGWHQRKM